MYNDGFNGDDSDVRFLMERGDMGYRPGEKFPHVNNTGRGQTWQAVMGRNLEEFKQSERYAEAERAKLELCGFKHKKRKQTKLGKMRKIEGWKYKITTVTLTDPDIMPRYMKVKDFVNLNSAIAFTNSRGRIFNVHLTINWRYLGYNDKEDASSKLYKLFIKQYTEWCRDNDFFCNWIYSNESSDKVGPHTHFMTSIDEENRPLFEQFIGKRLRKINKSEIFLEDAYAIAKSPKKPSIYTQWVQFQYLCKGINQNAKLKHANGLDSILVSDLIRFGYESPGDVACKKRCGLSRNIDKKARKDFGFESSMEKGYLNIDVLYSGDEYRNRERSQEEIDDAIREALRELHL